MTTQRHREEIAVSLHDVEPATFTRCALIRDWLDDHGIGCVTLLVVPAPDLHPLGDRSEELVDWLCERRRMGDAIAQHGLRDRAPFARARSQGGEFARLDAGETRRAVESGWRILRLAGLEPQGFVAPAFAYTPALHAVLPARFAWWAGLRRLYRPGGPAAGADVGPALSMGTASCLQRATGPWRVRRRAARAGQLLRLDLSPFDLDRPRHIGAVEAVLERSRGRVPVTLGDVTSP